jgi:hypothetical protein
MSANERTFRAETGSVPRPGAFGSLRWFKGLSVTGKTVVVVGLLLIVICVLFAEENWRGRRAWEACRKELDAKRALDWQQFIPPQVADDQNFAMTPFLAPLFDFNPKPRDPGQSPWRDPAAHDRLMNFAAPILPRNQKGELPPTPFAGHPQPNGLTDLEGALALLQSPSNQPPDSAFVFHSRAEAASATLAALDQFGPVLDELRSASRRPHFRYNIDYDTDDPISILLPHYIVLTRLTRILEVRASAELALGKSDAAFEDVELMYCLAGSIRDEPFMVEVSARGSMARRTVQIIWEGLAGRNWSEPQLKQFQKALQSFNQLKDLARGLRAERAAFGEVTFRYIRGHKNALRMWMGADEARPLAYLLAGPEGWLYQEQVTYHRLYDRRVLASFDPDSGYLQPHVIDQNRDALKHDLKGSALWHHNAFAGMIMPHLMKAFQIAALGQDGANQAATACALERYRLANGKYPDALAALVPQFLESLPMDVCNGQSLKYRLQPDGEFVLYGVGWNEKDDGGTMILQTDGQLVAKDGDWVWPAYPGTNAKVQTPNSKIQITHDDQKAH